MNVIMLFSLSHGVSFGNVPACHAEKGTA